MSFFATIHPFLWWLYGLYELQYYRDGMAGPGFFAAFAALFGWPLSAPLAFAAYSQRLRGSKTHVVLSLALMVAGLAALGVMGWGVMKASA